MALCLLLRLLVVRLRVLKSCIKLTLRLLAPEGEPRGLQAAAPLAGQHAADGHRARSQDLAEPPRLLAPLVDQVALGRAVVEPEPRRIGDAAVGGRVAGKDDLAAATQERPAGAGRGGGRGAG